MAKKKKSGFRPNHKYDPYALVLTGITYTLNVEEGTAPQVKVHEYYEEFLSSQLSKKELKFVRFVDAEKTQQGLDPQGLVRGAIVFTLAKLGVEATGEKVQEYYHTLLALSRSMTTEMLKNEKEVE